MRALVTGVSQGGFGGALCVRLARDALARGQSVHIAASATGLKPGLTAVVDQLTAMGARATALAADLSDPAAPGRLVSQSLEFCGGLDAVASNAGIFGRPAKLCDTDEDDWDRFFAINTRANWLLAHAAYPALKASRGALLLTSSGAGVLPYKQQGLYGSTKAAVILLAQVLAQRWASDGVRVNSIAPGVVRTPLNEERVSDPAVQAYFAERIPMRRLGSVDEIAAAMAFLLGPGAASITGENLLVDGGFIHSSEKGAIAN
jgi:glucose 1-dehydrogenase